MYNKITYSSYVADSPLRKNMDLDAVLLLQMS